MVTLSAYRHTRPIPPQPEHAPSAPDRNPAAIPPAVLVPDRSRWGFLILPAALGLASLVTLSVCAGPKPVSTMLPMKPSEARKLLPPNPPPPALPSLPKLDLSRLSRLRDSAASMLNAIAEAAPQPAPSKPIEVPPDPTPVQPQPQPVPPQSQPAPTPNVLPAESSDPPPHIVLQDRLGNDLPRSGRTGELFVAVTDKSSNIKSMLVEITPEVGYDWDARTHKLIFTATTPGKYTLTFTAASKDGELTKEVRDITFLAPPGSDSSGQSPQPGGANGPLPPKAAAPTNYTDWVLSHYKLMTHANRKADLSSMSGSFYSAWGMIQTGGIHNRDEAFRYVDRLIESALGPDLDACTPFLQAYLDVAKLEPISLSHIASVFLQTAEGMKQASRIPGP